MNLQAPLVAAALALSTLAASAAPQAVVKLPRVVVTMKATREIAQLPRVVVTGYSEATRLRRATLATTRTSPQRG